MNRLEYALYTAGVISGALLGFLCPLWYLGFGPLAAGLIWAAYDFDFEPGGSSGKPPSAPR